MKRTQVASYDPFEKASEFLVALARIQKEGMFEQLNITCQSDESGNQLLAIKAIGFVPAAKKYRFVGVRVMLDPKSAIDGCRKALRLRKVKYPSVFCEIKSEDWLLWDKDGNRVIGSRGQKYDLSFSYRISYNSK